MINLALQALLRAEEEDEQAAGDIVAPPPFISTTVDYTVLAADHFVQRCADQHSPLEHFFAWLCL